MASEKLECNHCVLTSDDDRDLTLNEEGVCNYCTSFEEQYVKNALTEEKKQAKLEARLNEIKSYGKGKQYDCIIGVSGGVDSSYLCLLAHRWGLKPLLVHFDNGWNSELAVHNINKIIEHTGFDLFTYVVDWEEFKNLQLSFIKASVIDWELPTDHGFYASLYKLAYKKRIKYILTGANYQTEAILPKQMRWSKKDLANIEDIHRSFGSIRLKSFPRLSFYRLSWYDFVVGFDRFDPLELVRYVKDEAKQEIIEKLEWRDYGGKHYESFFTKFYQGYILPNKFGVDKRRAHLSNLICAGQISREEALEELKTPPYPVDDIEQDIEYFNKKMGLTRAEFDAIVAADEVPHTHYKSYVTGLWPKHERFMKRIKPLTSVAKKVIGK